METTENSNPTEYAIRGLSELAGRDAQGTVMLDELVVGTDLPRYVKRMAPFPFQSRDPFQAGNPRINFHDRFGLARDKVRYVGEPVALVVAEDRYAAEDALELVTVELGTSSQLVPRPTEIELV